VHLSSQTEPFFWFVTQSQRQQMQQQMNCSPDAALQVVDRVCSLLSTISSHLPPLELYTFQANLLREQLDAWPKSNVYAITTAVSQHLQAARSAEAVPVNSKWLSCAAQCMFLLTLRSESADISLQCWNVIETAVLPAAAVSPTAGLYMLQSLLAMQEVQRMAAAESALLLLAAAAELNNSNTAAAAIHDKCTLICALISNQLLQTAHTDETRRAVLHLAMRWLSCRDSHYINYALKVLPGVFAGWNDAAALAEGWQLCCQSDDMNVSLAVLCLLFDSLCTIAQPIPLQQQLWQLIHTGLATGNTLNSKRALHLLRVTLAWLNSNSSTTSYKRSGDTSSIMLLWKQYATALDTLQTEIAENLIDQVWPTVQRMCTQACNLTAATANPTENNATVNGSSTDTAVASSSVPSPLDFEWLSLLIERGISAAFCTRNGRRKRLESVLSGVAQLPFYTAESYQWISAVFLPIFEHKATAAWFKSKPTDSNLCVMLTQWLVSVHAEAQLDSNRHILFTSILTAIDQSNITVPAVIDAVLTAYSSNSSSSMSNSGSSSTAAPLLCISNMTLLISVLNKVMFWWRETHAATATLSSGDLTTVVLQLLLQHTDYTDTSILDSGLSFLQCLPTTAVTECIQLLKQWLLRIATAAVQSDTKSTVDSNNGHSDIAVVAAAEVWLQNMIAHKIRTFMTVHTITTISTESRETYQHSKAQARLLCYILTVVFDDNDPSSACDNSLPTDKQQLLQLCQILAPVTACLSMCYSRAYMNPELIQRALVLFCQLVRHAATVTTAQQLLLVPLENCFTEVASYVSAALLAQLTADVTAESVTDSSGNSYTVSVLLNTLRCLYTVTQLDRNNEVQHSMIAALNSTQLCYACAHILYQTDNSSTSSMHRQLLALKMLHCILLHACNSTTTCSDNSDMLQLDAAVLQQLLETLVQANTGSSSISMRQYHELQWQFLALLLHYNSTKPGSTHAAQAQTQTYPDSILTRLVASIDGVIEVNLPSAVQCIGIVSSRFCDINSSSTTSDTNHVAIAIEQAVLTVCRVLYQAKNRSHKLVHMVSYNLINTAFVNHHARKIAAAYANAHSCQHGTAANVLCMHVHMLACRTDHT
jgi:hypothetical protein